MDIIQYLGFDPADLFEEIREVNKKRAALKAIVNPVLMERRLKACVSEEAIRYRNENPKLSLGASEDYGRISTKHMALLEFYAQHIKEHVLIDGEYEMLNKRHEYNMELMRLARTEKYNER